MATPFNRLRSSSIIPPIILLIAVSAVTYLPFVRSLGFYADDWFMDLQGHTNTYGLYLATGRPGQTVLLSLGYALLGDHVLGWHLASYALNLASAIAALWMLRAIWPKQNLLTTSVALMTLVFPAFSSQPISVMYIHWYLSMTFIFLSIGLSLHILNMKSGWQRWLLTALSALLGLGSWLLIEQFFGLELVRLYLIWSRSRVTQEDGTVSRQRTLIKTFMNAVPYLLVFAGYGIWRGVILSPIRANTNSHAILSGYLSNFASEVGFLFDSTVHAVIDAAAAWITPPDLATKFVTTYRPSLLAALALAVICAVAFWFYVRRSQTDKDSVHPSAADQYAPRVWIVGGLYFISIMALPLIGQFQIVLANYGDRFFFGAALGLALLFFSFFRALSRPSLLVIVVSVMIGLGVGTQFLIGNAYRADWDVYRTLWWQFSWRVPQLKAGTLVLVDDPAFFLPAESPTWEEDIWGPLNHIYGNWQTLVSAAGQQFTPGTARGLDQPETYATPIDAQFYNFKVDVRQNIIVTVPRFGSCVHILNGNAVELPIASTVSESQAKYSQIDRILVNDPAHTPSSAVFGTEPTHDWCYYYEKADLARQRQDWQQVRQLADEVTQLNLHPSDPTEWLPFLEESVRSGDDKAFESLAKSVPASDVCALLNRVAATGNPPTNIDSLKSTFSCSQ